MNYINHNYCLLQTLCQLIKSIPFILSLTRHWGEITEAGTTRFLLDHNWLKDMWLARAFQRRLCLTLFWMPNNHILECKVDYTNRLLMIISYLHYTNIINITQYAHVKHCEETLVMILQCYDPYNISFYRFQVQIVQQHLSAIWTGVYK